MSPKQVVWLDFDYKNKHYEGEAIAASATNSLPPAFDIYFDNEYNGTISKQQDCWIVDNYLEEGIAKIISRKLFSFLMRELQD